MSAVLLLVECACGSSHDVWGEESEDTQSGFTYDIDDLRCPACDGIRPESIRVKESLA